MKLQTNENKTNEHVALNFEPQSMILPKVITTFYLIILVIPIHFFNTNIQNLDNPYIVTEEFQNFLDDDISESLPILHLNIRSIKKNF